MMSPLAIKQFAARAFLRGHFFIETVGIRLHSLGMPGRFVELERGSTTPNVIPSGEIAKRPLGGRISTNSTFCFPAEIHSLASLAQDDRVEFLLHGCLIEISSYN
jgi:hypothetical protein